MLYNDSPIEVDKKTSQLVTNDSRVCDITIVNPFNVPEPQGLSNHS